MYVLMLPTWQVWYTAGVFVVMIAALGREVARPDLVLLVPVALAAAATLEVDPTPFAVAVALAALAGFATPFGYQTNLIVMVVALLAIWIVWL